MTTEQKAKAYDYVLERAKEIHQFSSDIAEIKRMEDIFPELKVKESEDERIRKWLIGYFQQYKIDGMDIVYTSGFKADDIIAWLEKQSEKPTDKVELKKTNYQPRVADYEDFREWEDEKSEVRVAIADLETPQDPILIRLDRIYDLLLEIKNNNMLRQPYIETCPPYPYPIQPWYDTSKPYCNTINKIEDEKSETNM